MIKLKFPVGDKNILPNNSIIYHETVYVFKPEGMFKILEDPARLKRKRRQPAIVTVYRPPWPTPNIGKEIEIKENKIFFSVDKYTFSFQEIEDRITLTCENPDW